MTIRLRFTDEEVAPPRAAERDFEWLEEMGSSFRVANPDNPSDTVLFDIYDNNKVGGIPVCEVMDRGQKELLFEEILKYGFTETTTAQGS